VSVHGANRLGSNSLLDLVVFGREAARRCAEIVKTGVSHKPLARDAADFAVSRMDKLRNASGVAADGRNPPGDAEDHATRRRRVRTGESLNQGIGKLAKTFASFEDVRVTDRSLVWNTDLVETLELENLLLQPRDHSFRANRNLSHNRFSSSSVSTRSVSRRASGP